MKKTWSKIARRTYLCSEKLLHTEKIQLFMTSALSFICVLALIMKLWPILDFQDLVVSILLVIFVMFVVICITRGLFVYLLMFLSYKCKPYADEYERSMPKEKPIQSLGLGPKASVTLKYFIEQEKGKSPYSARYLGPM